MNDEEKNQLKRRIKTAKNLGKRLGNAIAKLPKVPAFDGRADFADTLYDVKNLADKLIWDLEHDEKEV